MARRAKWQLLCQRWLPHPPARLAPRLRYACIRRGRWQGSGHCWVLPDAADGGRSAVPWIVDAKEWAPSHQSYLRHEKSTANGMFVTRVDAWNQ